MTNEKLTRKDSNLQRQNQNLVCYRYTTNQRRGRDESLILFPQLESVSSAPALAMEEVCVAALETICLTLRPVGWRQGLYLTEA